MLKEESASLIYNKPKAGSSTSALSTDTEKLKCFMPGRTHAVIESECEVYCKSYYTECVRPISLLQPTEQCFVPCLLLGLCMHCQIVQYT